MHRKEEEILAILGLILSVTLLIWTIFYLRLGVGRVYQEVEEWIQPDQETRLEWTEKDYQVKEASLEFGRKVTEGLLVKPNYDYIYNVFSETQKESEFGYDIQDARRKLESIFGRYGFPKDLRFSAQIYNNNNPVQDWNQPIYINNIYRVAYDNSYTLLERRLTIRIKFENDRFFIYGVKFE
jgi:hypothetical protein